MGREENKEKTEVGFGLKKVGPWWPALAPTVPRRP